MQNYKTILSIAGSDSGAGAGIQADIKTAASMQCYCCTVINSVTAQNTQGVNQVFNLPLMVIENQLAAVVNDIEIDAVKIGMLGNVTIVELVAHLIKKYQLKNVVLDTVFKSTSGKDLLSEAGIAKLKTELFPLCDLIIPNVPEAEILLGGETIARNTMRDSAVKLGEQYKRPFLLKGGHLTGHESKDYLFLDSDNEVHQFAAPTIDSNNIHGTGCTLSTAIACGLAKGFDLIQATSNAKSYITQAIGAGRHFRLGKGNGPVHHFFKSWQ